MLIAFIKVRETDIKHKSKMAMKREREGGGDGGDTKKEIKRGTCMQGRIIVNIFFWGGGAG